MPSIAIESYLVDDLQASAPADFTSLRMLLTSGVPREVALADSWSVIVLVPTGLARPWLDGDPAGVVSASEVEQAPRDPEAPDDLAARSAARLVVRRGGSPLAAIPLAAGVTTRVLDGLALLEVMPLTWDLRVSAMRGTIEHASRVELAWRSRITIARSGDNLG